MVKDKLQNFPLPPGQSRERVAKQRLNLRLVDRMLKAAPSGVPGGAFVILDQAKAMKQLAAAAVGGSLSNNRKEPCLEFRLSIKSGLPLQDLDVDFLQQDFCFRGVTRATTQSPAVALLMMGFQ